MMIYRIAAKYKSAYTAYTTKKSFVYIIVYAESSNGYGGNWDDVELFGDLISWLWKLWYHILNATCTSKRFKN